MLLIGFLLGAARRRRCRNAKNRIFGYVCGRRRNVNVPYRTITVNRRAGHSMWSSVVWVLRVPCEPGPTHAVGVISTWNNNSNINKRNYCNCYTVMCRYINNVRVLLSARIGRLLVIIVPAAARPHDYRRQQIIGKTDWVPARWEKLPGPRLIRCCFFFFLERIPHRYSRILTPRW